MQLECHTLSRWRPGSRKTIFCVNCYKINHLIARENIISNLCPAATALTGLRFLILFQISEVCAAQTTRVAISRNPAQRPNPPAQAHELYKY